MLGFSIKFFILVGFFLWVGAPLLVSALFGFVVAMIED
jgi:hypothetical protein